jgi:energy-converting hydrogenase Eha subunit A
MLCIIGIIIFVIYQHYLISNKWKRIIKEKPMLRNSHKLSIIFTIAFTVFGIVILVAGMILGRKILESA